MKYIVYRTTCLINNKIYVGVHHTDDPNIFDGYLGRGFMEKSYSVYKKSNCTFSLCSQKIWC